MGGGWANQTEYKAPLVRLFGIALCEQFNTQSSIKPVHNRIKESCICVESIILSTLCLFCVYKTARGFDRFDEGL